jgi:hypothetical protein
MASNLPPGVTDSMILGNRPEDREIEATIGITVGDLDTLEQFLARCDRAGHRPNLYLAVRDIVDQINTERG